MSTETLDHIDWQIVIDIVEYHTASSFRVKQSKYLWSCLWKYFNTSTRNWSFRALLLASKSWSRSKYWGH